MRPPASDRNNRTAETAAWAAFDADWYLRTYPQVRGRLIDLADAAVFAYWRDSGQKQGHSPNPFFDEAHFLRTNPSAADAVRAGRAPSGFAVYCADLGCHRSPHWLFDETYYRRLYPDLTDATLAENGLVNGYDHFLRHGAKEGRFGSPFFDPAVCRANLDPKDTDSAEAEGWFVVYLARLHAGETADCGTSVYFDPVWYLRKYPPVPGLIAKRRMLSALHHYLTNDTPTQFDPLPEFSEQYYLKLYPDVAAAVKSGRYRSGYDHFLANGVFERRSPCPAIDLAYYVATHRTVQEDIRRGAVRDAFAHYLAIGRAQGLAAAPLPDETFTEGQARTLLRLRAEALVPPLARNRLDFSHAGPPALSVVMVVRDEAALTLQTLASLRAGFDGAIELILVDAGSTDATTQIERCVDGATVLRFEMDIGVLRGSNAGLLGASADRVLLLGNAAEPAPGAVAAALRRLDSDAMIGAVGGKLIGPHGRLREAGGVVWRGGALEFYLRDASPDAPEANFVRDVAFCSSAFLMVRAHLLTDLEGFAAEYAPGTCADADLCLRIAATGARVVYDPSVVVRKLRSAAPASDDDQRAARDNFAARHAAYLRTRPAADPQAEIFARGVPTGRRRILFIDQAVPLRMGGGLAARSNDMIAAMAAMGLAVTVFPLQPHRFDLAAVYGDFADSVEVMHDRAVDDLADFLNNRTGYYDVVWVARTATLDRIGLHLQLATAGPHRPRIVLDTGAIAALQTAAHAALSCRSHDSDADGAIAAELANAALCQDIVAISAQEAAKLRELGWHDVSVIGPTPMLAPTPRGFQDRAGMLFVGSLQAGETPNLDGLCWFVDAVLPLVQEALGWETRLTIAGATDDPALLDRFRDHPRITLRGALRELAPLYDAHRIFVAPTRFAAGLPYKVYEAASHGVPVVASDLLRRQMGWQDGEDLLSASTGNPAAFAARIVTLYRDAVLWQRLRDAALVRLAAENSPDRMAAALRALVA